MTQLHMIVTPFPTPFLRNPDWNRLRSEIQGVPQASLDSPDRSALARVFSGAQRQISYWDHSQDDCLRTIAERLGFKVNNLIPRPFVKITIEPVKGEKQEFDRMKIAIERRGGLRSFVADRNTIYAHTDFDDKVSAIITDCGYKQKSALEDT